MNDFTGMEDLLSDFLLEAGEMLSEVENRLKELENFPDDSKLLNEIFRGFHTIKGGAGFLNASELVALCHITENLFDKLRNREMLMSAELMDAIFAATTEVRRMFGALQQNLQPSAAPGEIIDALKGALTGQGRGLPTPLTPANPLALTRRPGDEKSAGLDAVDWDRLYKALTGSDFVVRVGARQETEITLAINLKEDFTLTLFGRRATDMPGSTIGRREGDVSAKESMALTINIDSNRLDQVFNLSGEIGSTKNRLTRLRSDILQGHRDADTMHDLDQTVSQMDKLVVNLHNAVMKTRMYPIGRLLKKYSRLAKGMAQPLGKDVELMVAGEQTEMDKSMIGQLHNTLVHLVRNAVEHGAETVVGRIAADKPEKCSVELSVRQEGDYILIKIADDGQGMRYEVIRNKAIERGLISREAAYKLSEAQCLELIFLPGFSTRNESKNVSGRSTGMAVVKTNIQQLNGFISIQSEPGKGTAITIQLPPTLAILPVLILRLGAQLLAVPLFMVREILPIAPEQLQQASGRATMLVREEVLPVLPLARLIGWEHSGTPAVGALMQCDDKSFVLTADAFAGRDQVVVKAMDTFRPKGIAGVAVSREGDIVLILDVRELLGDVSAH